MDEISAGPGEKVVGVFILHFMNHVCLINDFSSKQQQHNKHNRSSGSQREHNLWPR